MQETAMTSESLREPKQCRSTLITTRTFRLIQTLATRNWLVKEELYLEETEEEVVAILDSYVSPASQGDRSTIIDICAERESHLEIAGVMTDLTRPRMVGNPDEQLVEAVEELITGDSEIHHSAKTQSRRC